MNNTSQYWNTGTCAKDFDCSAFTIRHSRSTGQLFGCPSPEFIKIGSSIFYKQETIEAWKNAHGKSFKNTAEAAEVK
jgi:hypothetical protein